MHDPSPELQQMLHDFYVSYFPKSSKFELPNNGRNKCVLHSLFFTRLSETVW